jgi:acetolactate synthase I/II/III large subunit
VEQVETVADLVSEELAAAGVTRVFGLPGGEVLQLMDALRRRGIEFALFRHEAHAGIAAAVFGKLSGTVGVVLTTLGPGASNLLLPIANSYLDREPLLAISAQIPDRHPAIHTHQRLPLGEIFRPITKYSGRLTRSNIRPSIRQAVSSCTTEPMGPSYLTLSADEAVEEPAGDDSSAAAPGAADSMALLDARIAAARLRALLVSSERPLVLLGLGAASGNAMEIRKWLSKWRLPFGVTPKVKGLVDETEPGFVGVVGGMAMDRVLTGAVRHADLVVGFGLDPVEIDQTWHAEVPVSWILEAPFATGIVPDANVIACRQDQLLDELIREGPPRTWSDSFDGFRKSRWPPAKSEDVGRNGFLDPLLMIGELARVMPPESIVVTDVGSHKYLFGQFWPSRLPNTFLVSNGLSAMGYGLPAAIGAKLARRHTPVLLAIGDGGFSMTSQELETARRLGAAVIVIVMADRSYSLIRLAQESRRLPNFGVDFGPIDSVAIAEACGVPALRVQSVEQLVAEVAAAARADSSLVVEVPVALDSYRGIV